jgi:uncharacterized repeat protein (TIGR01451 family)
MVCRAGAQPGYADLQISFTNSARAVTLGQYFNVFVFCYNTGWDPATNAVVTNRLPPGLDFVSVTSSRGTVIQIGGELIWNLGNFPPYQPATLTVEFRATSVGSYTNTAGAIAATPDSTPANNETNFITTVTPARFFGVGRPHAGYSGPTLTTLTNQNIFVAGLWPAKATDVYNPATRQFTAPAGTLVRARSGHSATLLNNGLVLLAGGASGSSEKTAEVYDPVTQLFRRVGDMLVYSYGHRANLQPDGQVLLCGGGMTTNELFNPVTETFSLAPAGPQCDPPGVRLPDGRYFQGSSTPSIYDPVSGNSTSTGPLNYFRFNWTAAVIPPDKVLVTGGDRNADRAELYDIPTGTFTIVPSMTTPRLRHGATALPDGTVLIVGGSVNDFSFGQDRAEIFDLNGTANVPGVGISDAALVESDNGTNGMLFTVWLTSPSALPVTVEFATAQGSAGTVDWGVANVDFAGTNGTLTIPPGATNAVLSVPVFGDVIWESDETFTLNLSLPTQAWLARKTATGKIFNNDPLPTLAVLPGSLSESDLARSNMTLQVSLSMPTPATVTVDYFTANGSASANSDYIATNSTLTFGPGATLLTVEVPVLGDLTPESDETFSLNITNAQNAVIIGSSALGTIINDDAVPGRLHHFDWAVIPSPQIQTVPFPVTITARDYFGGVATNVPWPVRLSAESPNFAATNLDFEAATLAPWTTFNYAPYEKTFDLQPVDVSGLGAVSMAFRMSANGGTNGITQDIFLTGGIPYTISANVLIKVDDVGQSCWGGDLYLHAGTNATSIILPTMCAGLVRTKIALTFTPPADGSYPLQFTTVRSYWGEYYWVYLDDVQISHPLISPSVATNFINGVWSGNVAADQPGVNFNLAANDNAGHSGTSASFDVLPATDLALSVAINWPATLRTGDQLAFNLVVTNRGPSASSAAEVQWELPPNLTFLSASNPLGTVTNHEGLLHWSLGALAVGSNATATLLARADLPGHFTNVFALTNSIFDVNLTNNSVAVPAQVLPPLLAIGDASDFETNGAATGIVFALTLSGPSGQTITVDYITLEGTATNNLDFVATNGTVTFAPGTTNATIVVYAIEDILDEPNRSFTVLLTNAVNAGISDQSGAGTVLDDDAPPMISIADTALLEGDSGTTNALFQLTLSKLAITDVSVRCTTATNTAAVSDYTHTVTTVTFPAGLTNATYTVPVRGNTVNEPDETFLVNLTLPGNATIARTQAVGTIVNDDAVPGRLNHFVWDPIPSPRYKDWPFPVILRAVDYLGNPATNSPGTVPVKARTEIGFLERVADDFEDGDSIGWTNFNATFTATVTNETAVGGLRSLRLAGGTANFSTGLRRSFTNSQPNRISFAVRASRTNQIAGRLTANVNSLYRSVVFYFNNNGQMGLLDRTLGFRGVPYQSNRWYQVELSLNWANQRIDCRVDGALVLTNIAFPDGSVSGMDAVLLANQDNTTSWWDDIRVFHDNLTNNFSITPSNFTTFVSGMKSNLVTISGPGSGTNTFLSADDGQEHVWISSFFDLLQPSLTVVTPGSGAEGSAPIAAQVQIPVPFPQAITVTLTSTVPAELTVPASIVIPAHQTNASFNLTIIDDALLDGTQPGSIIARATNFLAATNTILVTDNEAATLTFTLPAFVSENAGILVNQGVVTASAPPHKPVVVSLTSSDTNIIRVPASVTIQSNQTTATFNLTVVDDQLIDGPQTVTVVANVANWTNATQLITVTDNENTLIRLSGPAQLSENGGTANYTARLSGLLATNLDLVLTSSDTNTLVVPDSATIPAGLTSIVITATLLDNSQFDGARLVTLSANAPGFTGGTTNVTVRDNEVHHLGFAAIAGPKTSSVPFNITVSARDIFDGPITAFNGPIALEAVGISGPVMVQPTNVTLVNGAWSGAVTVLSESDQVTLHALSTNGLAGQSTPFELAPLHLFLANVAARDLVYSPASRRLWGIVTNSGSLVPIDPFVSLVEPGVNVGTGPAKLAAAGDGKFVHVAVNSTNPIIRRLDTTQRLVDLVWSNGVYAVEDIAGVPGDSAAVAVSWMQRNASPRNRGVYVYDHGVARTNFFDDHVGPNLIEFSESSTRIYGFNNDTTAYAFYRMNVDAGGVTFAGTTNLMIGFETDFTCAAGLLFATTGQVFDPERSLLVGAASGTPVWGTTAAGRFFQWQAPWQTSPGQIVAYDLATFLPISATVLPGVSNVFGKLVPWDTNGLAFCANAGQVAVLRTPLIPSGSPTDLRLTSMYSAQPAFSSNAFTCTLTVTNAGPNPASGVVLAHSLSTNFILTGVILSAGSTTQSAGGLVCTLNSLGVGESRTVTLNLLGGNPGRSVVTASVTSDTTEANPTNNVVRQPVSVGRQLAPDSVSEVRFVANDIAWNATAGKIFASGPHPELRPTQGGALHSFNPANGVFDPHINVNRSPGQLAVSGDGGFIYIARGTDIDRVDVTNRMLELPFSTPYWTDDITDLEVVPGDPTTVVTATTPAIISYRNGVLLTNMLGGPTYQSDWFLEFSATPGLLYAGTSNLFRRIAIVTNGVTLIDDTPGTLINGLDRAIEFDGGRVFTPGGRVFDPEAKTNIATVPYSGLVAPDVNCGRVFYLTGSGTTYTLTALNFTNLQFIGSLSITNVSGSPARLLRWGVDGLAFRTTGGQIFLIRTTLADDRDNDTLPDSWEQQHFNSLNASAGGPGDDPDLDGFTNLQEARAGLDPHQFDHLRLLNPRLAPGRIFQCEVIAPPDGDYALFASSDFMTWQPVQRFTTTNIFTTLTDAQTGASPARFYRVGPLTAVPGPLLGFTIPAIASNQVSLRLEGVPGYYYRLESSTNLVDWTPVLNVLCTNPTTYLQDPLTIGADRKFYRVAIP